MTFRFRLLLVGLYAGLLSQGWGIPLVAREPGTVVPAAVQNPAPAADPLTDKVREALEISSRRYLDVDVHTPWQIIHGTLAYRKAYLIKSKGEKVNAVEWISSGATYQGTPWFEATPYGGRGQPYTQPYIFEGHPNQFLGYLSMSNLPRDHEIQAGDGKTITIAGLVRNAQMEVNSREEITWTLWGLSHYLEPDARWVNRHGEPWSVERLVQIQTREPVSRGACGGTHGLFALSYARNGYIHTGRPLRGVWLEADQKIKRYIAAARSLQNRDGSFSAAYFQGPNLSDQFETRIGTTGHTLEFLMVALRQDELDQPWVRRAITALADDLIANRREPAECGALYHAVHALTLYLERTQPASETEPEPTPADVAQSDDPAAEDDSSENALGDVESAGDTVETDEAPAREPAEEE